MAPEQPTTIDLILVERILSNLQSFTKVPKFGTLPQYQLLLYLAFLPLIKTKMLQVLSVKSRIEQAALMHFLFINDSRGGLCYKPSGFLKSLHHYCKFYYSFSSFYFNKANK